MHSVQEMRPETDGPVSRLVKNKNWLDLSTDGRSLVPKVVHEIVLGFGYVSQVKHRFNGNKGPAVWFDWLDEQTFSFAELRDIYAAAR